MQSKLFLLGVLAVTACGGDDDSTDDTQVVIDDYIALATSGYEDSRLAANGLSVRVSTFVANPGAEAWDDARDAWESARVPYRLTEALRFYGGPIDAPEDDREGQLNAWPLDEATIDYVVGNDAAGVINDPDAMPDVTADAILEANFQNGESDVKTGFHAIEFLLWGQDQSADGPGARPLTDYTTAANADRRGDYLLAVTDLLVDDLTHVQDLWVGGYLTDVAPEEALRRILTGIGTLAASELSGERMLTAYENKDQEDEHSCFSDETHLDLIGNAQGIVDVYRVGIDRLVAARDAELAAEVDTMMDTMMDAIQAIPAPFDQAILGDDSAPGRVAVLAAVRAVQDVGDAIVEVATALGVEINTAL